MCAHNKVNNNKARGDPQTEIRQSTVDVVGVMPPNTITICYTYTAQKVSPSPENKNAKESPALWLYKSGIRYLVAGIINLTREMPGKLAHKSDGLQIDWVKGKATQRRPRGDGSLQSKSIQGGEGNESLGTRSHLFLFSYSLSLPLSFLRSLCDQLIYQSQWKTRPSGIKRQ